MYHRGSRLSPPAMAWVSASDGSSRAAAARSWISRDPLDRVGQADGQRKRIRVIRFPPSGVAGTRMLIGIVTISSSTAAPCSSW